MITKNLRHRFIDRVTNGQFVDRQKYRQEVIDKQPQTREPQKTVSDKRNASYSTQVSDRMIVGQKDSWQTKSQTELG